MGLKNLLPTSNMQLFRNYGRCAKRIQSSLSCIPRLNTHFELTKKSQSLYYPKSFSLGSILQNNDNLIERKPNSSKTHFGFQSVPEELKETLVSRVFSSVASSYDVMNDCMSFGIHRLWKDHFIRSMAPGPGTKLLDVAGGTGDIAIRFLEYCQKMHHDSSAHVCVVDINPSMLAHGLERYHKSQFKQSNQALFQVGNAECLENIEDNSFDVYTISFGIRNCTHIGRVLKEAYRVLKPGGRFMCLEFSKVDTPVIKQMYDLYSFQVIPQLGALVAKDRNSYQYLVESIRQFPNQKHFSQMIRDAGFAIVGDGYENLTFGVAAIHTGYKF